MGLLEARVGFEPAPRIGYTYLTHFTLRLKRQKRLENYAKGFSCLAVMAVRDWEGMFGL